MNSEFTAWLNRLGILLNLIGGFLVAPEIIGVSRIENLIIRLKKNTKNLLNRYFESIRKIFRGAITFLLSSLKPIMYFGLFMALCVLVFEIDIFNGASFKEIFSSVGELDGVSALIFYVLLGLAIIVFVYAIHDASGEGKLPGEKRDYSIALFFIGFIPVLIPILMLLIAIFISIASVVTMGYLVFLTISGILLFFLSLILRTFNESIGLRNIVIRLGIILLVIGTLFQLIATF